MGTFAHGTLRGEPFHALLPIVFCLVLLHTIAVYLGCVVLSADVAVVVTAKVLFHSIGAVIELVLVYMAILYHPSIDYSISHFRVYEFDHY